MHWFVTLFNKYFWDTWGLKNMITHKSLFPSWKQLNRELNYSNNHQKLEDFLRAEITENHLQRFCLNKSPVESEISFLRCSEATGTKLQVNGPGIILRELMNGEVGNSCQKRNPCSWMEEVMLAVKTGNDFERGLMLSSF